MDLVDVEAVGLKPLVFVTCSEHVAVIAELELSLRPPLPSQDPSKTS